jgi:hypothetical protein
MDYFSNFDPFNPTEKKMRRVRLQKQNGPTNTNAARGIILVLLIRCQFIFSISDE